MNTHNTICDKCDNILFFYCMCCLPNATESRLITHNIAVRRVHNGTKVPHLQFAGDNTADQSGKVYTQALKEMERAAERGERSHHYLCVQRRNLQQRSVIWLLCCNSISRALSVPFPSVCLKRNINNITDVTHTRQRPTAATPGQRSSVFWRPLTSHLWADVWADDNRMYADILHITETEEVIHVMQQHFGLKTIEKKRWFFMFSFCIVKE